MSPAIDERLKAKYDSYYDGESDWRRVCAVDKVRHIRDVCAESYADVLEVGAGEGSVLAALDAIAFAPRLYGLEISASAIASLGNRRISRLVDAKSFDGYRIPYPDKHFDLVIATHVLEHVEHERVFLKELRRVARTIFVEVPLEDTIRLPTNIGNELGHINFYRRETLLALLRSVQLTPRRWRLYDHSLAVSQYHAGLIRGAAKTIVRRSLLNVVPSVAEKLFTYHLAVAATS